jgi:hypothetical protein
MALNLFYQGIHKGLHPIEAVSVLPYSSLATLTRAAEYARLYPMFAGVELVQNHEARKGPAVAEIIEKFRDFSASL